MEQLNPLFTNLGIDPIEGTQIVQALNIQPWEFENAIRFHKIKDIVQFFRGNENAQKMIHRLTMNSAGTDKIDFVWSWMQLEGEKQKALGELNPDDFDDTVQAEIKDGHITEEKLRRIEQDLEQREKEIARKEERLRDKRREHRKEQKDLAEREVELEKKQKEKTAKIKETMGKLRKIQQELNAYEP